MQRVYRSVVIMGLSSLVACAGDSNGRTPEAAQQDDVPPVVEVTVSDFSIAMPDSFDSGWTTFELINAGEQEHFAYIYRLPEGMTFAQFKDEFYAPFGKVWELYARGELTRDEAGARFGEVLPEWFFTGVVPSGGPALTEPGETSRTTVYLDPGTHVVECYVKMPDGGWHTEMGMQRELTVTTESNGALAPEADFALTLSNYAVTLSQPLTAGQHTIAVQAVDTPEGLMTHDINLFRLDNGAGVDEIVAWMDWMDLTQFRAPAPGYSLGGVEHLAAGRSGYFNVDLAPGDYAWVSEGYGAQGVVSTFTID